LSLLKIRGTKGPLTRSLTRSPSPLAEGFDAGFTSVGDGGAVAAEQ
jgi:hypothetical protein